MYSSNGNKIGNDPISYSDQPFLQRPFLNDIISSSKQADSSPLSFFQFPSPFEDEGLFPQQHCDPLFPQPPSMRADYTVTETVVHMAESNENHINRQIVAQQIPRKRSSKRDRHSKINTARGPRDRRMRLSLEVARKFFGLQDMLGYDKASKTVEWLLVQAKAEIKKLARETKRSCSAGTKSASSTSECEVASAVDEVAVYYRNQVGSVSEEKPSRCATKEKKIRQWRNCAFHPLAKESREKARARARERTREKMKNRKQDETKLCEEATNCDLSRLGSWSPFETGEESGTQSHNMNPSLDVLPEIEEGSSRAHDRFGAAEDMVNNESLVFITTWSPSMIFSSLNNPGISYEHQLADLHSFGKSWEA